MGMTMTQKILAAHAGLDTVEAGQLIEAKLDIVMANDITGPMALPIIRQMSDKVFDKDKVVFVPDHFTPNKDIKSAENSKAIREYAKEQGLKWYFEQGKSGVEHAILPEAGVVTAGECIIGADSHTCTYGALGAFSTGMGTTDVATGMATGEIWFKVPSAIKFVLTGKPGKYVSGKAAAILKGHTVHPDVRVMVVPATQKIYKQCIKEGLLDIFVDAGCAVNTPSCGPCMGGHMGVMAAGEKCVSTTNRNFVGRMGHVDSLIYLASPEVAAASAIKGYIANPEKISAADEEADSRNIQCAEQKEGGRS